MPALAKVDPGTSDASDQDPDVPSAPSSSASSTCSSCSCSDHPKRMNAEPSRKKTASLAYQLWFPWRLIALNPLVTAVVYILTNGVFIITWLLVRWLIAWITAPGLLLLLVIGMWWGLRRIALMLSYPGHLELVVRDGESNYARLTRRRLQMVIEAANDLVVVLSQRDRSATRRLQFVQTHQNLTFAIDSIVVPFQKALERVEQEHQLGPHGTILRSVLNEFVSTYNQSMAAPCATLAASSTKEFEPTRHQLFLADQAPVKAKTKLLQIISKSSDASQLESKPSLVAAFAANIDRLRDVLQYIGAPPVETKRDVYWVLGQLVQRSKSKPTETITDLNLMRADLAVRFNGEQVWINGYGNHPIDTMFLPAKAGFSTDKPVMLLCNPNGCLYEFHHLQLDWIRFYTEVGDCHVMLFNYRGYGRTKGDPSADLHNLDALAIIEYLKTQRKLTKIGVHGESIGGVVATYVASHRPNDIKVLVADRTFASLPAIAQRLVGNWAGKAVKLLTGWETDNVTNFVGATCPKLVCSDPQDDIIQDGASLKSGVALRVELADQTFDLQDFEVDDGPPLAKQQRGLVRRYSESELHPQPGSPLTEEVVRRFSGAVLSIGRRAMRSTAARDAKDVRITIEASEDEAEERTACLSPTNEAFPSELVAMVWMQLASLDGYCGDCLLQAVEAGGHERIRAWTASLLFWGGQLPPSKRTERSLEPFDCNGILITPLPIVHVHKSLQLLQERHPAIKYDYDIGFLINMVEYLLDSLQRRWAKVDTPSPGTNQSWGQLLVLHCGHNRNFLEHEKNALVTYLQQSGFLMPPTTATP